MFGGQQHECWASPRSIINQKLCSKCMTLVLVDCTLVFCFFFRWVSRQSKSGMPPSILSALCLMLLWVTDLQTEGFELAQRWWLERLLAEVSAWAGPPLICGIILYKNTLHYTKLLSRTKESHKVATSGDSEITSARHVQNAPAWPQSHTHTRHNMPHSYSSNSGSSVLFWWQIRFAVMKGCQWTREKSAESCLVTVQQSRHHLHLAIWMSSGSVAGYCTSLNSSSLDNSRWLSQIKLHPIQRILWVTAHSPDHSDKSTSKVQL